MPLDVASAVNATQKYIDSTVLPSSPLEGGVNSPRTSPTEHQMGSGQTLLRTNGVPLPLDVRDYDESTPLIQAALCGKYEQVSSLIAYGANPDLQNTRGYTALSASLANGFMSIASFLLQNGADPNLSTIEGATPLHLASIYGDEPVVLQLLNNGAFLNAQDEAGDVALHWIVREGREDMLSYLLKRGADPNIKNEDGETPLHLAAAIGEAGMVELLLLHGAYASVRDHSGSTPLDEALENEHYQIAQLLSKSMGTRRSAPARGIDRCIPPITSSSCSEVFSKYGERKLVPAEPPIPAFTSQPSF
jgi:ankyrin repeat protein